LQMTLSVKSLTGSAQVHPPATWVITPVGSHVPGGKAVAHGPHGQSTASAVACRCPRGGLGRVGPSEAIRSSESARRVDGLVQRCYCRVARCRVFRPADGALTSRAQNDEAWFTGTRTAARDPGPFKLVARQSPRGLAGTRMAQQIVCLIGGTREQGSE
jgi:hypothetical protein